MSQPEQSDDDGIRQDKKDDDDCDTLSGLYGDLDGFEVLDEIGDEDLIPSDAENQDDEQNSPAERQALAEKVDESRDTISFITCESDHKNPTQSLSTQIVGKGNLGDKKSTSSPTAQEGATVGSLSAVTCGTEVTVTSPQQATCGKQSVKQISNNTSCRIVKSIPEKAHYESSLSTDLDKSVCATTKSASVVTNIAPASAVETTDKGKSTSATSKKTVTTGKTGQATSVSRKTTPATSKTTPVSEKATATLTTTLVSKIKTSVTAKTTPAAVKTIPAIVKNSIVPVKTPPTTLKTTLVSEKTTPATVKKTPVSGKTTTATVKRTPVSGKTTPLTVKKTLVSGKTTPTTVKTTPVSGKATPATLKTTPVSRKTTPTTLKTTPAPGKTTPATVKTTPVSGKTTPATVKTSLVSGKTTSATVKTTLLSEKTTPATVKTTPLSEKTHTTVKTASVSGKATSSTVKMTPTSTETTPVSEETSLKGKTGKAAPVVKKTAPVSMKATTDILRTADGVKTDILAIQTVLDVDKPTPVKSLSQKISSNSETGSATATENKVCSNVVSKQAATSAICKAEKGYTVQAKKSSEFHNTTDAIVAVPDIVQCKTVVASKKLSSGVKMESVVIDADTSKLLSASVPVVALKKLSYDKTVVKVDNVKDFHKPKTNVDMASSSGLVKSTVNTDKDLTKSKSSDMVFSSGLIKSTVNSDQDLPKTKSSEELRGISGPAVKRSSSTVSLPAVVSKGSVMKTPVTSAVLPSKVKTAFATSSPTEKQRPAVKASSVPAKSIVTFSERKANVPLNVTKNSDDKLTTTTLQEKVSAQLSGSRPTGKTVIRRIVKRVIHRKSHETMTDSMILKSASTQTLNDNLLKIEGADGETETDKNIKLKRVVEKQERQTINRLKTVMLHPVRAEDMADPILQPFFLSSHCLSARFLGSQKGVEKKGHLEIRYFSEADANKYVEELQGLKLSSGKYLSAKILGHCGPWDGSLDDWQRAHMAEKTGLAEARCVYVHNIPPDTEEGMLSILYPDAVNVSLHLPQEGDNLSKGHALLEFAKPEEAELVVENSKNYQTRIGENTLSLTLLVKRSVQAEVYDGDPPNAKSTQSTEKNKEEKLPAVKHHMDSDSSGMEVSPSKKAKPNPKPESTVTDVIKVTKYKGPDIKQFLFQWCQSLNITPHFDYKSWGPSHRPMFRCEVVVPGYNYVARGTSTSKKNAQTKGAYDFAKFLIREGEIDEADISKCVYSLIVQGLLSDPKEDVLPFRKDDKGRRSPEIRRSQEGDRMRKKYDTRHREEKIVKDKIKLAKLKRNRDKESIEEKAQPRSKDVRSPKRSVRTPNQIPAWLSRMETTSRKQEQVKEEEKNITALKLEITKQLAELQAGRVSDPDKLAELAERLQSAHDAKKSGPVGNLDSWDHNTRKRRDDRWLDVGENELSHPTREEKVPRFSSPLQNPMTRTSIDSVGFPYVEGFPLVASIGAAQHGETDPTKQTDMTRYQHSSSDQPVVFHTQPQPVPPQPMRVPQQQWSERQSNTQKGSEFEMGQHRESMKAQLINRLKQFQDGKLKDDSNILTKLAQQLLLVQQQEEISHGTGTFSPGLQVPGHENPQTDGDKNLEGKRMSGNTQFQVGPKPDHAAIRENLLLRLQTAGIHSGTINSLVKGLKMVQAEENKKDGKQVTEKTRTESVRSQPIQSTRRSKPPSMSVKLEMTKQKVQQQMRQKIQQIKLNQMAFKMAAKTKAAARAYASQKLAEAVLQPRQPKGILKNSQQQQTSSSSGHPQQSFHTPLYTTPNVSKLDVVNRQGYRDFLSGVAEKNMHNSAQFRVPLPHPTYRSRTRKFTESSNTKPTNLRPASTGSQIPCTYGITLTSTSRPSESPGIPGLVDYPASP